MLIFVHLQAILREDPCSPQSLEGIPGTVSEVFIFCLEVVHFIKSLSLRCLFSVFIRVITLAYLFLFKKLFLTKGLEM